LGKTGDPISTRRDSSSLKQTQTNRKHPDVVIIKTSVGIELISGIRAAIIRSAFETTGYTKHEYLWPIKNAKKSVDDVVVLCDTRTGDYKIFFDKKAIQKMKKPLKWHEVEFSYFKPKKKKQTKKN
jgi:hypothetical protein